MVMVTAVLLLAITVILAFLCPSFHLTRLYPFPATAVAALGWHRLIPHMCHQEFQNVSVAKTAAVDRNTI